MPSLTLGIVGDFDPAFRSHAATDDAIAHAAAALRLDVVPRWLPTPSLAEHGGRAALEACDALWAAPGSPYASLDGALEGLRFARERGRPLVAT